MFWPPSIERTPALRPLSSAIIVQPSGLAPEAAEAALPSAGGVLRRAVEGEA
jgi:hypothetical protein